jgi:hypothetical protein
MNLTEGVEAPVMTTDERVTMLCDRIAAGAA